MLTAVAVLVTGFGETFQYYEKEERVVSTFSIDYTPPVPADIRKDDQLVGGERDGVLAREDKRIREPQRIGLEMTGSFQ